MSRTSRSPRLVRWPALVLVGCTLLLSLTACRVETASGAAVKPTGPRVYFTDPKAGASVTSPVTLKWAADGIKIEPAADGIKPGSGHLHVMVNAPCLADGQVIPTDDTHLHYGKAQTEVTLELKPGTYKLCLQMADAAHIALSGAGMRQEMLLTVR